MPPTMNMRGPRNGQRHGVAKMPKGGWETVRRLLSYVLVNYKWSLVAVLVCIAITSVTTLTSSLFTKTLIDDYIMPLMEQEQPDFGPLAHALIILGGILAFGACCAYIHSRLMINVSQGTLRQLRFDVFGHMQKLPIKYFDQHAHGDIMSVYTNDIDTLRQMISSLPNLVSSILTITLTLTSMFVLSLPLTILTILMSCIMVYTTRKLGTLSARYFRAQQENLGKMNGFIEEMLTGQKVVKTFCYEDKAIAEFQQLNENLRSSVYNANKVANIVMPVNGNLSNLVYVLTAIIGAALALNAFGVPSWISALTIGTLVSFLTLVKNFTRPVSEVSQQINSIINAVAGASRVFNILDAKEEDDGNANVTLVNAREDAHGQLTETSEETGIWAWKVPQEDGSYQLIRQRGEVDFFDVDFSYPVNEETEPDKKPKQVL
ncbi:MAG: ABC transporter ATP-binding protein, partial [Prevotella sp.]|nr:ABC transporter ATP-binding protein [Prevotella sp.]